MFQSIQRFFNNLFGSDSDNLASDNEGWEDASDLPVSYYEEEESEDRSIPTVSTRSIGTRSVGTRSIGDGEVGEVIDADEDDGGIESVRITKPRYLWCLDNGHGSTQKGKRSPVWSDGAQLEEWRFNREIVKRIMASLDKIGVQYFNVVPEENVGSFLGGRVGRANNKVSDLGLGKIYLSVHANAAGVAAATGIETWYHLNSAAGIRLASAFQKHLMDVLSPRTDHNWKDRGIRTFTPAGSNFFVLRNTSMPAVLTENGFYSNEAECRELLKPEVLDAIAEAHVAAIVEIELHGYETVKIYPKNRTIQKN